MIKCIKKQIMIDFEGGNDETAIILTFNMPNITMNEKRTVIEELLNKIMPTMNEDKQTELDDLLYCLDLMYKQSQQAKDSFPIHPDRFKLIKNMVGGFYANAWQVWESK